MQRTAVRIGLAAIVAFAAAAAVVAVTFSKKSASHPDYEGRGSGPVRLHGLEAHLTEKELAEKVPNIITGSVISKNIVALKDDPFLPSNLSEGGAAMVASGASRLKLEVAVSSWLKGAGSGKIFIVRGVNDGRARLSEEFLPRDLATIEVGKAYKFLLEPDEWFGHDHYVLVRVLPV